MSYPNALFALRSPNSQLNSRGICQRANRSMMRCSSRQKLGGRSSKLHSALPSRILSGSPRKRKRLFAFAYICSICCACSPNNRVPADNHFNGRYTGYPGKTLHYTADERYPACPGRARQRIWIRLACSLSSRRNFKSWMEVDA